MITATNPPEGEPEPEPVITPNEAAEIKALAAYLVAHPESLHRPDRYVDDKFLKIFNHEDRNGALSRIFTEGLSQNDNGARWAPITSWRDWWQRAKRAEDHR